MIELGELEQSHAEFAQRQTRVVAVSVEGLEDAKLTQADFPHLTIVADKDRSLSSVADVIHPGSAPDGGDTAAPATLLVDRQGVLRWANRPDTFLVRLTPKDVLAAIDKY